MTGSKRVLAGVELGGTKCICLIGTGPHDVRATASVPTGRDPAVTLGRIEDILVGWRAEHGPIAALGVASFGPLDLAPGSPRYGFITSTVKPGWRHTDVASRFGRRLEVPVAIDTDVNGAALAEGRWGGAQGLSDYAYVTVGTGIGVGLVVAGRTVLGFTHTELGHIRVARAPGDDWPGSCSFHGDCVEGLASGSAIAARLGVRAAQLAPDDPVWALVVHALAQLLHTLVLATAPRRILLGGGVMNARAHLFDALRQELRRSLNAYVDAEEVGPLIADYVVPPGLGAMAGPLGALAIASDAAASF